MTILWNDLTSEILILQYQREAPFGSQSSHRFNHIPTLFHHHLLQVG